MLPSLLILFSFSLMGFVILANQVFGAYLRDFSDLLRATRRILLMLLGNVSLSELEDVDRAWTVLVRCSVGVEGRVPGSDGDARFLPSPAGPPGDLHHAICRREPLYDCRYRDAPAGHEQGAAVFQPEPDPQGPCH